MPALNMKNAAQAEADVLVAADGAQVNYSAFSGPTGSPFDAKQANPATPPSSNAFPPVYIAAPLNFSTGALMTGIGFGCELDIGLTAPQSIKDAGFTDNVTPGVTMPDGTTAATTAILTLIAGGKSTANVNGIAPTVPYVAQPLLNMGNGGSRDAGAGPAFTGFASKMVTAAADIAPAGVIETGFVNRTGHTLLTGHSTDGSAVAASPAVT